VRKWLTSKGIEYEERDAEKIPQECVWYEIQSLPTVRIGNEILAVGNDMRKLQKWLKKHGVME